MNYRKNEKKIIIAIPKGRILKELTPILTKVNILPEKDFFNLNSRKIMFSSNNKLVDFIKVRSFDVVNFVAYGGAHLGIVGLDVIEEFSHEEIYAPVNLRIGICRLSVAEPLKMALKDDPKTWSHLKIATKYPKITKKHFALRGVQAECLKLNGALEIAPKLDLSSRIVDLVSTGKTLKENGLIEVEKIMDITSYLIVNRNMAKTYPNKIKKIIANFRKVVNA
ncbi:MAG: ATP phosphoribosyltransferase [Pelagibacterales bacterium]|nr:ATP phosphoribosyltransferase [Pelagibacterales bacterium]OUU61541.1 MAG: ATP phosphoribosyltransferase [Alphaproteobacteria bacterium TMED62]|tara:strand:- start:2004 stop:2672 length:669 start_codon:yes stop_codon:yes gene_type:complete